VSIIYYEGSSSRSPDFSMLAQQSIDCKIAIVTELNDSQGKSIDLGGYYYHPDREKIIAAVRSSGVFNSALAQLPEGIKSLGKL
jgi:monomeric isocitrate dehydrogenase